MALQETPMADEKPMDIQWLPDVEDHDYPSAASYLSLVFPDDRVAQLITALKAAPLVSYKARDIFRASQLSLLGVSNSHVEKDRKKILGGTSLSPLLLVRGEPQGKVVVADGYHRLCAVYSFDEDAWIRCKIV
jgi:hypothetical protein